MADYIYLLQTRLTPAQQTALATVRDIARARNLTVFLVGGAVRDLTSGSPIRDLDVVVQGSAPKLKKDLEKAGGRLVGESDQSQSLFFHFPGGVRLEVGSTLAVSYPKPGKPVARPATILEDLRRRDFTANAMAISLNEGSYGLLMDPLNGVADIENRELRLVSNYGFIEDPARMVRAARFGARLGWHMEEKTQTRYDNGKNENYITALSTVQRGYETEEIIREEDPLRVLKRLESEGWMKHLFPAWTSAKVNESELTRLRDTVGQLNAMGIYPDPSAAYFPLLTAKLAPKEVSALKQSFARAGFGGQIDELEAETKSFGAQFVSKEFASPSAAWKLLMSAVPEHILWLAHTSKSAPVQARFKAFFTEWPTARLKIPYALMQEMRIVPDLPGYGDLIDQIFFAIMDGKMDTPEAARAYLEPFSPPAPPPPVNLRRRAVKRETKVTKTRSKKAAALPVEDGISGTVTPISLPEPEATASIAQAVPTKTAPARVNKAFKTEKTVVPAKVTARAQTPTKKVFIAKTPIAKPSSKQAAATKSAKDTVGGRSKQVVKKIAKADVKSSVKKASSKKPLLKAALAMKKSVPKPKVKTELKKRPTVAVAKPKPPSKKVSKPVLKPKPQVRGKGTLIPKKKSTKRR